ncbi:MAG: DUF4445 domain-containing protein [Deltaproteobacteria bacterium]|nr:DUF4445 domain-containing protein [Deltaproteobacteria bacterium]
MDDEESFLIEFQPLGLRDRFPPGRSLLDCARQSGIDLVSICGGKGTCGKCRVQIVSGKVSESFRDEAETLSAEDRNKGYRLACRTTPESDLVLNLPPESLSAPQRLQVEGLHTTVRPDPLVPAYDVSLAAPSLSDLRGDDDRLFEALEKQHGIVCGNMDQDLSRSIPSLLRSLNWEACAAVRGTEIVDLGRRGAPGYGMAVDLGTTKIAGYLVNLDSGQTLSSRGMMNPQISCGEDVVSRLAVAARSPEDGEALQVRLLEALNTLAQGLCRDASRPHTKEIREIVVVGNTAMHHLLLRLPVEQLARAPYVPAVSRATDVKARHLGISAAPGAYIHLPPNVAGYVGGDHLAMLAAIEAWDAGGPLLAIDIGTNTEISLVVHGEVSSVSCASGPAFEGAHMSCGMRAAPGAIDQLRVSGQQIEYHTIHGSTPAGLCGSGIIDTLAQLFLNGIVDETGRMQKNHPRVRDNPKHRGFTIVSEEERGGAPAITLTQEDVRELQLAKAAIRTGIHILLKESALSHEDIREVVVAGAFGSYLDISSTIAIGMLPPLPLNRFRQVGNAAGAGAKALLVSGKLRRTVQEHARRIRYLELARVPEFQNTFVQALSLGWEK